MFKKTLALALSLALSASLFAGCGGSASSAPGAQSGNAAAGGAARDDLVVILPDDFTTLDPFKLPSSAEISFCANIFDGLVEYGPDHQVVAALADSWEMNEAGDSYTFQVERLALDSEWNKMLLSYAIQSEINAGKGTRTGGVYFDLDLYPKEILEELYTDLPPLKTGIYADIMKILEAGRALTVTPAAHYFEGGVHVNANMETAVRGLYAAGECAGGMFGANRVSAATTEMLVEGARAGSSAGAYAREAGLTAVSSDTLAAIESELLRPFANSGPRPGTLKKEIQDIAGGCLTVIRSGEKLEQALGQLNDMQDNALGQIGVTDQNRICNRQWLDYLEARSMLLTARAIVQSALLRSESRGVHIREDCFVTDNQAFFKNTVIENISLASRLDDVKTPYMQAPRERMPYIDYIEQVVEKLN